MPEALANLLKLSYEVTGGDPDRGADLILGIRVGIAMTLNDEILSRNLLGALKMYAIEGLSPTQAKASLKAMAELELSMMARILGCSYQELLPNIGYINALGLCKQ